MLPEKAVASGVVLAEEALKLRQEAEAWAARCRPPIDTKESRDDARSQPH